MVRQITFKTFSREINLSIVFIVQMRQSLKQKNILFENSADKT